MCAQWVVMTIVLTVFEFMIDVTEVLSPSIITAPILLFGIVLLLVSINN